MASRSKILLAIITACVFYQAVLQWWLALRVSSESPSQSGQNALRTSFTTTLRGKPEPQYNFTTAICVCVKDSEYFFEEWIDYHLAMKFDAIYIYDDSPTFELKRWYEKTRNHDTLSKVEVIHYDRSLDDEDEDKYIQKFVYKDCVNLFGIAGPKHDYFAFIDIDEFFVLKSSNYTDIRGVIQDYLVPFGGALTVNWMMVGSSNKSVASPLPVTKRFQYRANETQSVIKTIAKASDYNRHRNPHAVYVKKYADIHTTKFPGALHKEAKGETGASDDERPSDVFLLYHYRYTSNKEYIFKRCVRGQVDMGAYWCTADGKGINKNKGPAHIQPSPGDVFDDTPWRFLTSRVPKYKLYDQFEDYH